MNSACNYPFLIGDPMRSAATDTRIDLDEWLTFYRLDCECGQSMEVKSAWAGTIINCSACRRKLEITSLSGFKELPAIMRPRPIVEKLIQFGTKFLLLLFVPFSLFAIAFERWPSHVLGLVYCFFMLGLYILSVVAIANVVHNFRWFMAAFWDAIE